MKKRQNICSFFQKNIPQIHAKTIHTLCFCMLMLTVLAVQGNGDPVALHSAITLSRTPVAMQIHEVQLVDEFVTFTPRDRYMEVNVRYLLHNHSDRSFEKLPYGFPIDYFGSGSAKWESLDDVSESQQETGWRDSYIQNVSFTLGGVQLSWQCSRDSIIVPRQKKFSFDAFLDVMPDSADTYSQRIIDSLYALYGEELYTYTKPISRRWYYTYLNIPAQSYVVLEVHYTVECALSEGAYYRKFNLLEYIPNYYWELRFQYDFSPAAYWGNGHADHFTATLDTTGIRILNDQRWIRAQDCRANGIQGLPMQRKGQLYQYETQHFDLAATKPFVLDYKLTQAPHQSLDRLLNHRIPSSEYTIEVSGADKKYPAANLSDLNPATATVLKQNQNDSIYITIRFHKPTALEGMLLLNGYTKNAETYRNNSRIDSLCVFGSRFYVYEIDGRKETSRYNNDRYDMLFGEKEWIKKYTDYKILPGKYTGHSPKNFDWQSLVDDAMMLGLSDGPWGDTCYEEIRIIITAAAKGLKYDDLCVSEIILVGK